MKKVRLIITYDCNKNCTGCCNKNWKYAPPKIAYSWDLLKFDEIYITGGEPMLVYDNMVGLVQFIKKNSAAKIFLYTAYPYPKYKFLNILRLIDGTTVTIHDKLDAHKFFHLKYFDLKIKNKSMRLNVFGGGIIPNQNLWEIKFIEWVKDCPLPDGEVLMRLNNLYEVKH